MEKKNKREKVVVSLSIEKKLNDYMDELFDNKSKYIEWLIYQDLDNSGVDVKKIII